MRAGGRRTSPVFWFSMAGLNVFGAFLHIKDNSPFWVTLALLLMAFCLLAGAHELRIRKAIQREREKVVATAIENHPASEASKAIVRDALGIDNNQTQETK